MSTRSMTPRTSCSEPIGISVATTCWPNALLRASSERKKSSRSRSSMLTNSRRARSSSSARCHSRVVVTSTPITALTTKMADSQTRRAPSASATNDGSPGVSMRLTLRSSHSNEDSAAEIDIWRAFSSLSASDTVVPSTTEPSRLTAPAWWRSASCSDVLTQPRCPTRDTLRIRSGGLCIRSPLSPPEPITLPKCGRPPAAGASAKRGRPPAASGGAGSTAKRDRPSAACGGAGSTALDLRRRRLLAEPRAHPQHGLGVELRDARLGHAEHLADLAQGEVLVVVEGDDELLALGQARDRVGDAVVELGLVHDLGRVGRLGVLEGVEQRDLVTARVRHRPELVEGRDGRVRDLDQRVVEVLGRDLEIGGHLLVGGGTMEPVLELDVGPLDVARPGPHGPRHPVQRAQFVDDGPLDARDGVGLEPDLAVGLEALDRRDQAAEPVRDEVGLVHVRG